MSMMVVSPEESIEHNRQLLEEIRKALSERTDGGYPKNLHLSNVLWKILRLWEDGRN